MSISFHDVERLQSLYPDCQIEFRDGKILIMSPSDSVSGEIGVRFSRLLDTWVYNNNLGRVLDSSTGIRLPNGDMLSPDISFVSRERLKRNPRTYLPVVPELVVEIKSSTDRVSELQEKIALFLSQGVQVGIIINPDTHVVTIYRTSKPGQMSEGSESIEPVETLKDGDILIIPDLFPGWEIPVSSLWPRVFE